MKVMRYLLGAALSLLPMLAGAEPRFLSGTIGKAPVVVMLQRDGATISGWYLYLRYGKDIQLEGKIDAAGNFTLNETDYPHPAITGILRGAVHGAQWTGTWSKPTGEGPVSFALNENHDTLAAISGHFSCTAKQSDRQSGFTFDESISLNMAHGAVTQLTVSHAADRSGERQECSIGLSDLERAQTRAGVLFRAKGDDPADKGAHCSVHIIAVGDYLYLKMGDFTEDGNDCLGVGDDVRFCSPRGNFNDLLVNRKIGTCAMVQ
jgi:hypothetical protein